MPKADRINIIVILGIIIIVSRIQTDLPGIDAAPVAIVLRGEPCVYYAVQRKERRRKTRDIYRELWRKL